MKATINVDAKTATLEGMDNSGDYQLDFHPEKLTEEQKKEIVRCPNSNETGFKVNHDNLYTIKVGAPTFENLVKILDNRIEERKKRIAEKENRLKEQHQKNLKALQAFMELPVEDRVQDFEFGDKFQYKPAIPGMIGFVSTDIDYILEKFKEDVPGLEAEINKAKEFAKEQTIAFHEERNRKITEKAEIKRQEELEAKKLEREKKEYIKSWIEKNGTQNQKDRFKDGYLPEKEVIDEIRDEVFMSLFTNSKYKRLSINDVPCDCCEFDGKKDVKFSVEDQETLTGYQYDIMKNMKEDLPNAVFQPRRHMARCERCGETVKRIGLHVTVKEGPFVFTREYNID